MANSGSAGNDIFEGIRARAQAKAIAEDDGRYGRPEEPVSSCVARLLL